jgi:SAM-dependent methyltransferase
MHDTALELGRRFFETYARDPDGGIIADIGSMDVNGSLRDVAPVHYRYVGIDVAEGKGVDKLAPDPYTLPLARSSVDIVVSTSCFEHVEFFWLSFLEALRVLKPGGLFYLNAPSNGAVHRHPVDCWRFYPDAGHALARWGVYHHLPCLLLESFLAAPSVFGWRDFVAVFSRGDAVAAQAHERRILDSLEGYDHGFVLHPEGDMTP